MKSFNQPVTNNMHASPFDLTQDTAYLIWREHKIGSAATPSPATIIDIRDPDNLSAVECAALLDQCQRTNMVLYNCQVTDFDKKSLMSLCLRLGLEQLDSNLCADGDGVSSIQVEPKGTKQEYIPYSEQAINWHTDGYYNSAERRISGMVLHCVRPSAEGGINGLIDPERIYIELRDRDPQLIETLQQDDVLTIPANIQSGVEIRAAQTGPVFSLNPISGQLHMRYTARTRSIEWKQDSLTQRAVKVLSELLNSDADYVYQFRLSAGQGIISNNVLHNRSRFEDSESQTRLLYRARFFDRVGRGNGILTC